MKLVEGTPAPFTGVYRAVTENGELLDLSVKLSRFEPLPRAIEGSCWQLERLTAA